VKLSHVKTFHVNLQRWGGGPCGCMYSCYMKACSINIVRTVELGSAKEMLDEEERTWIEFF
jgi:hypothetical protein